MTLNEVYTYLKMNGLPVTLHDDTRIRLEGSTAALDNILFTKVYNAEGSSCFVDSDPSVMLIEATQRDLVNSYLEHCDPQRIKMVRSARLRYAIDNHNRQTP